MCKLTDKKKLLLLGGSAQQVVAIETAKRLGYYTVLCDYLRDNPGQYHADSFYLVSTTDRQAVLKVAEDEQIHGIVAYASDPAAPTAAYVAERMGLPTNPYQSVETLCNKDKFRDFLRRKGFNAPVSRGFTGMQGMKETGLFRLPVIVKPVDSSGSKGVTVISDWKDLESAISFALSFSRCGRYIVEEFIEKNDRYLVAGDIFVINGKIEIFGLLNSHRDENMNPLVPIGESFPLMLEKKDEENVRLCLQRLVDKLNIKNGAMNVELVVDEAGEVWPIDIGPRSGGNMIPELLAYIFDVDVVEMIIRAAMGEELDYTIGEGSGYCMSFVLHSDRSGRFDKVTFDRKLESRIFRKEIHKKRGDEISYFDNASKALGIIFIKFENAREMSEILENISSYIQVETI